MEDTHSEVADAIGTTELHATAATFKVLEGNTMTFVLPTTQTLYVGCGSVGVVKETPCVLANNSARHQEHITIVVNACLNMLLSTDMSTKHTTPTFDDKSVPREPTVCVTQTKIILLNLQVVVGACGDEIRSIEVNSCTHFATWWKSTVDAMHSTFIEQMVMNRVELLGRKLLLIAILENQHELVRCLYTHNIVLDLRHENATKCLLTILHRGRWKMLKLLFVDLGCEINQCDTNGNSFIVHAVQQGVPDQVEFICKELSPFANSVDHRTGKNPESNLHQVMKLAARNGNVGILSILIQCGGVCHKQNDHTADTLLTSVMRGHAACIKLLYRHGVQLDTSRSFTFSCLIVAMNKRHWDVLYLLYTNLACDVEACDENGESLLIHAIKNGNMEATTFLCTELNACVNPKMPTQHIPLHVAVARGRTEIVKCLCRNLGANSLQVNVDGETILFVAQRSKESLMLRFLLEPEFKVVFDINVRNVYGRTVLYDAIIHGRVEMASILLCDGQADGNQKNDCNVNDLFDQHSGETPVFAAVWAHEKDDLLQVCIRHGVDLEVTRADGTSVVKLAEEMKAFSKIAMLRKTGTSCVSVRNRATKRKFVSILPDHVMNSKRGTLSERKIIYRYTF
jgi:ankyrin repeat protein